jgi:hypothetical protein
MDDVLRTNIPVNVDDIANWAQIIQKESLCFSCTSALYGLTKLLYNNDLEAFDKLISRKSDLQNTILTTQNSVARATALSELQHIFEEIRNIKFKFFFINSYESPAEYEKAGARLTNYDNVCFISLPRNIVRDFLESKNINNSHRKESKIKQRYLTAHEMAHELFKYLNSKGIEILDDEQNAKSFANELLKLREYYVNGIPEKPRIIFDQEKLKSKIFNWLSALPTIDFSTISHELPVLLEEIINNSELVKI